jgi:(E)-4-hydroxy-3-methylbut-2-enyl-diphosphate synthase
MQYSTFAQSIFSYNPSAMINSDLFHLQRFPSHEVTIGDRPLGANHPIRLQSMTNTDTLDVRATILQCIRIIEAGADYVRISAPNILAAHALKEIKKGIREAGFSHPLIADIHFNAEVALTAAKIVEKVRINPGNYTGSPAKNKTDFSITEIEQEKELIYARLKPLVAICQDYGTAIRIGTNLGSLSSRIITQYGNTPKGMVEATYEFLEIFRQLSFNNLVISLKASKPLVMIQAYEGMVEKMLANQMSYPLHIGITEAGEGENGRIKSALGICSLLNKGIGDTLRVSLTEDPEHEIPFAKKISTAYQDPFAAPSMDYKLNATQLSRNEITLTEKHHKAIVISSVSEGQTQNFQPEVEDKANLQNNTADFFFTENPETPHKHPSVQFIVPHKIRGLSGSSNSMPLVDFSEIRLLKKGIGQEKFLAEIKKEGIAPEITDKGFFDNLFGLVIAPRSQNNKQELDNWIAFSQKTNIPVILRIHFSTLDLDEIISQVAIIAGTGLIERKIQGLWLTAPTLKENISTLAFGFLQSSGLRITRTEFISCPTCARTSYNLQQVLKDIQKEISHLPGLKVAVMGCIVNGPGEMADADYGFVGSGNGKLHLYKGQIPVKKNIEPQEATLELLKLLKDNGLNI